MGVQLFYKLLGQLKGYISVQCSFLALDKMHNVDKHFVFPVRSIPPDGDGFLFVLKMIGSFCWFGFELNSSCSKVILIVSVELF